MTISDGHAITGQCFGRKKASHGSHISQETNEQSFHNSRGKKMESKNPLPPKELNPGMVCYKSN